MTESELADDLGMLADLMFARAHDMRGVHNFGGPDALLGHADELEGAADIVRGWEQGLRSDD